MSEPVAYEAAPEAPLDPGWRDLRARVAAVLAAVEEAASQPGTLTPRQHALYQAGLRQVGAQLDRIVFAEADLAIEVARRVNALTRKGTAGRGARCRRPGRGQLELISGGKNASRA